MNVSPLEVEEVLLGHPAVAEAAAVGMPDESRDDEVVAFVRLHEPDAATTDELGDHCRRRLASFKVPQYTFLTEELPTTDTGKLARATLRARALAEVGRLTQAAAAGLRGVQAETTEDR